MDVLIHKDHIWRTFFVRRGKYLKKYVRSAFILGLGFVLLHFSEYTRKGNYLFIEAI